MVVLLCPHRNGKQGICTHPCHGVITGDNYEQRGAQVMGNLFTSVRINVFNISKINSEVLMVETKSTQHRNEDGSWNTEVTEKAKAGVKWCANASQYLKQHGGKAWKYLLVPHDEVKDNKRLVDFIRFAMTDDEK